MDDETSTATAEAPSTGAGADHLAGLIGDTAPSPEPSPAAEPTAPKRDASGRFVSSAAPAAPAPTEGSVPATAEPAAAPPKFKYRGREYTVEELVQQGLLSDVLTSAEQLPHLQRKYMEALEQQRQAQQPPQQPLQPQETPQQFQARLVAQFKPEIEQVVQSGFIESDFAELYPNAVAQMLWHRNGLREVLGKVAEIEGRLGSFTGKVSARDEMATINGRLDALAERGKTPQGKIFAPLADPERRKAFLDFLTNPDEGGDPDTRRLTPEFLARMWVAMNHEALLEATTQAVDAQNAANAAARARAAGDGRGARLTAPAPQPVSHLDRMLEGALR